MYSLQWGRDKNVSEISEQVDKDISLGTASMGPRQKCLGNFLKPPAKSFPPPASMGPRQKCLGNGLAWVWLL